VRARIYTALRRAGIPLAIPATTAWVQLENDERARTKRERRATERLDALKRVALFRTFNNEELATLADGLSHVIYCAGETITRQGAVAHWLYLLIRGKAEIRTTVDPDGPGPMPPQTRKVTELEAPDVLRASMNSANGPFASSSSRARIGPSPCSPASRPLMVISTTPGAGRVMAKVAWMPSKVAGMGCIHA
jgi:hypothetical protein